VEGFGIVLTDQNLRSHLEQLRRDHQAYYNENPEVRQIHQAIRADRLARS
jgi:hypothetical protein